MDNKELFFDPGNACAIVTVEIKAVYDGILPASFVFKAILSGRMTEVSVVVVDLVRTLASFSLTKYFDAILSTFIIIVFHLFRGRL